MVKSKTYKERLKERRIFTVIANCESVGAWTNLMELSKDMNILDHEFLSYSSLSKRRKEENPITFETKKGVKYSVTIHILNEATKQDEDNDEPTSNPSDTAEPTPPEPSDTWE